MTRKFFTNIDLNQNESQFMVLHSLGSAPNNGSEVEGQVYYDTGSNVPRFWNGSQWIAMSSQSATNVPFNEITTGTNTSATMTVGNGAEINFSGTGVVDANEVSSVSFDLSSVSDNDIIQYNNSNSAFENISLSSANIPTGSASANQVTYWSGSNTITGSSDLTFNGTDLTITNGDVRFSDGANSVGIAQPASPFSDATYQLPNSLASSDNQVLGSDTGGRTFWISLDGIHGSIGTGQIADNAVTLAKIEDISEDTILGRTSAGSGDPEELSASQVRTILNVEDGATADQTSEEIQDAAWNVLSGTQTLITVTYDDGNNEVDFVVNDDLSQYDNATSSFISDITGESIGDLSDVSITTPPSSADVLRYNGSNWVNAALSASDIQSGTFADARISQSSVTQHEGAIDHDALTNFVGDEHIDHGGVSINGGDGLSGGGDITSSRTINVDINSTTSATIAGSDEILFGDVSNSNAIRKSTAQDIADLVDSSNVDHGNTSGLGDDDHSQYVYNAPSSGTRNDITSQGNGVVPFRIIGSSGQTANLFEVENNGNSDLFTVASDGSVTISGDLTVNGTTTTVDTTNLVIEDNFVVVNSLGTVQNAGIEVERATAGSADNAFITYNESAQEWFIDNGTVSHRIARKYTQTISGNGSDTVFNVIHNMGTKFITVQTYDVSSEKLVETDVEVFSQDRVDITFGKAPSGGDSYRVIVTG